MILTQRCHCSQNTVFGQQLRHPCIESVLTIGVLTKRSHCNFFEQGSRGTLKALDVSEHALSWWHPCRLIFSFFSRFFFTCLVIIFGLLLCREQGHPEALTTTENALTWWQALKVVSRRQWTLALRDRALVIGRSAYR